MPFGNHFATTSCDNAAPIPGEHLAPVVNFGWVMNTMYRAKPQCAKAVDEHLEKIRRLQSAEFLCLRKRVTEHSTCNGLHTGPPFAAKNSVHEEQLAGRPVGVIVRIDAQARLQLGTYRQECCGLAPLNEHNMHLAVSA